MRRAIRPALLGLILARRAFPAPALRRRRAVQGPAQQGQAVGTATRFHRHRQQPAQQRYRRRPEGSAGQGHHQRDQSLGRNGGFWNNAKVRIPLPGKLEQAGKLARQLGQGAKVDAFELSMNRAAEKAVPQVADIFGDAIRKMTPRAMRAAFSPAATTRPPISSGAWPVTRSAQRIHPIVAKATDSVGVTRKYKAFTSGNGGGSLGGALGCAGRARWQQVGQRLAFAGSGRLRDAEDAGRPVHRQSASRSSRSASNPAARTTDLLKKVFGSH